MKNRPLGNSGIDVSEIGIGAMQFGSAGWGGPDRAGCVAIIDEADRRAATFIDTAPAYSAGRSEELLGIALEGRRDRFVVCTKFGVWPDGRLDYAADRIEESVEASLRRLRTDYLDVALFHGLPNEDRDRLVGEGARVLRRLVDSGVIRTYGLSYTPASPQELLHLVELTGCSCLELRFNALHQGPGALFNHAAQAGIGLIINVPLESGWLSGKYNTSSSFDGDRRRWSPENITRRAALVEEFQALLPAGVSTTHPALSHILAQPEVSTIIPGTKSVDQLRDNLAGADVTLPDQTLTAVRELGRVHASDPLPW